MSTPCSPTFPLQTMTETQRQIMRQYLVDRYDSGMYLWEPIWFSLLLAGEKPGVALISLAPPVPPEKQNPSYTPTITIDELAEAFQLPSQQWNEYLINVAHTTWWLDLIPTNKNPSPAYFRRFGCFYGYPEPDIEHFITTDPPYTQLTDLVAEERFQPEELVFSKFVPQKHEDSITGFKRAIAKGKTNRKTIAERAHDWDLPELNDYAERLYERTLYSLHTE